MGRRAFARALCVVLILGVSIGLVSTREAVASPPTYGDIEFWTPNSNGTITRLGNPLPGVRSDWGAIVSGDFSANATDDLFFYDPTDAEAQFWGTSGTGTIFQIGSTLPGMRATWTQVIPGHFDNSGYTGLFFYDPLNTDAQFWKTDGHGALYQVGGDLPGMRSTWSTVVPGHFSPSAYTDLLFYDARNGQLEFWGTNGTGGIYEIGSTLPGVRKSWTTILAGNFGGGTGYSDLFFYDANSGEGQFYKVNGAGGLVGMGNILPGMRHTWTSILVDQFQPTTTQDLYFYDAAAGQAAFYRTDGVGHLIQIGSTLSGIRRTWGLTVPGKFRTGSSTSQLMYFDPQWPVPISADVYVAAHTDDDLLFMNPEIQDRLANHERIRVIYLTAGNDGSSDPGYWRDGRERGILQAYAALMGTPMSRWVLAQQGTPAIYHLAAYPYLEVEFLRMPNAADTQNGDAFPGYGTIGQLWNGSISSLASVDGVTSYTRGSTISLLTGAMSSLAASRVGVQDPRSWNGQVGSPCLTGQNNDYNYGGRGGIDDYVYDHVDHCVAARFGWDAFLQYPGSHSLAKFLGYTSATLTPDVSGAELSRKTFGFFNYAATDMNIGVPQPFGNLYDYWIPEQWYIN